MCLNPSTILNRSRFYLPESGQRMFLNVPCGHCSECISMYKSEWRLRSRYEALGTTNFVLFDTLTYRNGELPHISDWYSVPRSLDFPVFSKYDVQTFLKRLRQYLSVRGYDVKDKLRYFLCSEYGNDIRYTRRPHYHVLFFVSFNIDPIVLSIAISSCWQHGRTDGVPYRSRSYVLNRNVFRSGSNVINPVIGYVSKYISKSFIYSSLVNSRLSKLKQLDYVTYKLCQPLVRQFHLQSIGFGYNYLLSKVSDPSYYVENPFLPLENKQRLINYVSLPMSLQRRIFYTYNVVGGRVCWYAKPSLVDYKLKVSERQIRKLANRYASQLGKPFDECLRLATLSLFGHGRLMSRFKSIRDTLLNSYNIEFGLRNYACVDRGLLHKKRIFANCDYGSVKDGIISSVPTLKFDSSLIDPSSIHSVNDIKDNYCLFVPSVDQIENDLYVKLQHKGDTKLGVLKLMERLINIYKTYVLC